MANYDRARVLAALEEQPLGYGAFVNGKGERCFFGALAHAAGVSDSTLREWQEEWKGKIMARPLGSKELSYVPKANDILKSYGLPAMFGGDADCSCGMAQLHDGLYGLPDDEAIEELLTALDNCPH